MISDDAAHFSTGGATEAADILSQFATTPVSGEDNAPALSSQEPSAFDDPFTFMQSSGSAPSAFSLTEPGTLDLPPAGWEFLQPQVFDASMLSFFDTTKFG